MTAGGYGCEFCGGTHPVNWLVTRLAPAATVPLCAEDFPVGIIPLLAVELDVPVQGLYDAIKRYADREAAKATKAEAKAEATAGASTTDDGEHIHITPDPGIRAAVLDAAGLPDMAEQAKDGQQ